MSTSTGKRLPMEILERIIDTSAEDDERLVTVNACSLLCHSLLPRCRKHIFKEMSLLKYWKRRRSSKDLWELFAGSPELCRHVRTIVYLLDDEPPTDESIPVVPRQLTQLRSLCLIDDARFDGSSWDTFPHRNVLLPLFRLPTLTHLQLHTIDHFFLYDLIPCGSLKHLEITSVTFDEGPAFPQTTFPQPITVDQLTVDDQDRESLRALAHAQRPDGKPILDLNSLKTLHLIFRGDERLLGFEGFFMKVRHLVEFEVQFELWPSRLEGVYDALMGSSETLRSLKFDMSTGDHGRDEDPIPVLSQELEKMRYQNVIECMTFIITVRLAFDFDQAQADKWATLDDTLSKAGWPSLKYVSLVIDLTKNDYDRRTMAGEALLGLRETHFTRLASSSTIDFDLDVKVCN